MRSDSEAGSRRYREARLVVIVVLSSCDSRCKAQRSNSIQQLSKRCRGQNVEIGTEPEQSMHGAWLGWVAAYKLCQSSIQMLEK